MKRALDEAAVSRIMEHLLERFGEPIGKVPGADLEGARDERGGKRRRGAASTSNRGFGAKLEHGGPMGCSQCGGMMAMDGDTCTSCDMMPADVPAPASAKADAIVVVGDAPNPTTASAPASGKVATGVHPPRDMDGIPETGSGRLAATNPHTKEAVSAEPPVNNDGYMSADIEASTGEKLAEERTSSNMHKFGVHYGTCQICGKRINLDVDGNIKTHRAPDGGTCLGSTNEPTETVEMSAASPGLDEVTPPGGEKVVKALKKKKGVKNPWAVAWSHYNKTH